LQASKYRQKHPIMFIRYQKYINIPVQEVKTIVKNIIEKNKTLRRQKKEILDLLNVIVEQNYIQHN
jgi:hypothetical protein